mmetsp:Transcript_124243/g.264838  ORF Transcript_124243/g.264838 Transcript_124243/m.264838 type:complete len:202 (-) Transcript_124243:31-636(-)
MQPPEHSSGGGGELYVGPDLRARTLAWAQAAAESMPGALRAIPGDPGIAKNVSLVSAGWLLIATVAGALGLLTLEASAVGHLANVYCALLAAATLVLEADELVPFLAATREIIVVQAKCLGSPLGVAVLQALQFTLALAQGTAEYVLPALAALAACVLHVLVWYIRSGATMASNDNTGLIAGQSEPLPTEARNMDVMMQNC